MSTSTDTAVSKAVDTTEELSNDELTATQAVLADAVLATDQGWDVLTKMYLGCSQKLLTTQGFTLPVLNQYESLKSELNDPVAFTKCFQTLLSDLRTYQEKLNRLYATHSGRSGVPTTEEYPILLDASLEYSNLITHFETVITPLIMSLIEVIRSEHGDLLEVTPTLEA